MEGFDSVEELATDEAISTYLHAAAQRDNEEYFLNCLSKALRAQAINQLAAKTGIDRQVIYEMFQDSRSAKPDPVYIHKITATFGVTTPVHA